MSIVLYACETWTITADIERRTQMLEMRCFRKLLGIWYRDHITNEEVKARIGSAIGPDDDLLTSVKRRKLKRYGHVTQSSGLAKTILQGTVQGGRRFVLLVGCLTSQQHASVSQGRICSDNFTCCHTEIEVADPTFYLTRSQYTDTGPTSPSADPIMPGAWQGSHWSANFEVTGMTRPRKIPAQAGFEPWICRSRGGRLNH